MGHAHAQRYKMGVCLTLVWEPKICWRIGGGCSSHPIHTCTQRARFDDMACMSDGVG